MIKKIVSISLISVLVLSFSENVFAQENGNKTDTSKNSAQKEDLNKKLYDAISNNKVGVVEELLSKGVFVNQTRNISDTEKDITPLMLASLKKNKEIVELLIKNGADVNAKTVDGRTILMTDFNNRGSRNS